MRFKEVKENLLAKKQFDEEQRQEKAAAAGTGVWRWG